MVTVQPELITALTIIICTMIVTLGLVAILAPAASAVITKPLLDTTNRLIDVVKLAHDPIPHEPSAPPTQHLS